MKKVLALATTATMLIGLASCSNEIDAPKAMGDGNVNLTVTLPGVPGTRAFSDGKTAENLQVAVYDVTDPDNVKLATTTEKDFGNSLETTISLNLANGRSYKIALFASLKENSPYTFSAEERNITVDYTKMTEYNSTDNYDCFYQLYDTGKVTGAINETITLYRPVAQINWGTSDLSEDVLVPVYGANDGDRALTNLYTKVSTKAYTKFSLLDKDVVEGTQTDVNLILAKRPDAGEEYPYQPKDNDGNIVKTYDYLSMQYLLVPQASSIADFTLESAATSDMATAQTIAVVNVPNAPVQANYRTNIFGALLTNPAQYKVVKEKEFYQPDYNNGIVVSTPEDFVNAFTGNEDKTIILDGDVTIAGDEALNNTSNIEIELNGHTLTTPAIKAGEGKTVSISNGNLDFPESDKAIIMDYQGDDGTIELEGVTMTTGADHAIYFRRNSSGNTYHRNKLIIKDCELTSTGAFVISVGAGVGEEVVDGNIIEIENSTLKGAENAICNLQNVTVNAKNSNFYGSWQSVLFRSGNFNATDCNFYLDTDAAYPESQKNKYPAAYEAAGGGWGAANQATLGCVVIGSRGYNNYNGWPIAVKLTNCTSTVTGANADKYASVYVVCTVMQQTTLDFDNYSGMNSGCGIRYNSDYGTTAMQGGWIKINGREYTGVGRYTE